MSEHNLNQLAVYIWGSWIIVFSYAINDSIL